MTSKGSKGRAREESGWHELVLRGDENAFGHLCRSLMPYLVRMVCKQLRCAPDVAQDGAVDALHEYWMHPECYLAQRATLRTYLARLARWRTIDILRRRGGPLEQKHQIAVELCGPDTNMEVDQRLDGIVLWNKIRANLAGLADRDLRGVQLILDGERSAEAWARAMECDRSLTPVQRAKVIKRHRDRLLKKLRRIGRWWWDRPV